MMIMIESVQELPISLTNNSAAITFSADDIRTRSANCCNGWLQHQEGSPLYQLLEGGYYEVVFNSNVSSATPGIVALGLYQNGILTPGTTVASSIAAAGDVENVKFTKLRANATRIAQLLNWNRDEMKFDMNSNIISEILMLFF
jgi:hypothetical protein